MKKQLIWAVCAAACLGAFGCEGDTYYYVFGDQTSPDGGVEPDSSDNPEAGPEAGPEGGMKDPILIGHWAFDNEEEVGPITRAVQMAVDEVNAAGGLLDGRQVQIVTAEETMFEAIDGFRSLLDQDVVAVIGPTNQGNAAAADEVLAASANPIPYFSTYGGDVLWDEAAKDGQMVWGRSGFGLPTFRFGFPTLDVAVDHVGCTEIGYVGIYGITEEADAILLAGVEQAATDRGLTWRGGYLDGFIPDSLSEELANFVADPPECIMVDSPQIAYYVRDMPTELADVNVLIANALIPPLSTGIADSLAPLNGSYGALLNELDPQRNEDYVSRYEAVYGAELPDFVHFHMSTNYDMAALLLLSIEKAGSTDPNAILTALQVISDRSNTAGYGPTELGAAVKAIGDGEDVVYLGATNTTDYSNGDHFSKPPESECFIVEDAETFTVGPCPAP